MSHKLPKLELPKTRFLFNHITSSALVLILLPCHTSRRSISNQHILRNEIKNFFDMPASLPFNYKTFASFILLSIAMQEETHPLNCNQRRLPFYVRGRMVNERGTVIDIEHHKR